MMQLWQQCRFNFCHKILWLLLAEIMIDCQVIAIERCLCSIQQYCDNFRVVNVIILNQEKLFSLCAIILSVIMLDFLKLILFLLEVQLINRLKSVFFFFLSFLISFLFILYNSIDNTH